MAKLVGKRAAAAGLKLGSVKVLGASLKANVLKVNLEMKIQEQQSYLKKKQDRTMR